MASFFTWPLELLFRSGTLLREEIYDRGLARTHHLPVPVVSVGNLVVGGTGKTPVSAWIADLLSRAGHHPALVARGYGDDELALHRRWNPDIPVHAHPDRIRAGLEALEAGAHALVLDDGFQHRRLGRDLDLVLLAAEHPFPERLLPRGPYREPVRALGRADAVFVTHRTAPPARIQALRTELVRRFPGLPVTTVGLSPKGWADLGGRPADPPAGPVLTVTSVAGPDEVARLAGEVGAEDGREVELLAFPDHHAFEPRDIEVIRARARGRTLVITEKDAVKLEEWRESLPTVRVLVLGVEPEPEAEALVETFAREAAP
jgi:tetraacyldisaccharide 4'-kinase